MFSKHMKVIAILTFLVTLTYTNNIITLHELDQLSPESLQDGQLVEVVHTSESVPADVPGREYYVMKSIHKDKRTAYQNMQSMFERVVVVLKLSQVSRVILQGSGETWTK